MSRTVSTRSIENGQSARRSTSAAETITGPLIALFAVCLSEVPETAGAAFLSAQLAIVALAGASVVLPWKFGLPIVVAVLLGGKDIVSPTGTTAVTSASIWQLSLGPLRPSWLVFAILSGHALRARRLRVPTELRMFLLWFASVPLGLGILYGGILGPHAGVEVLRDVRYPLLLGLSLAVFLTGLSRDPETARAVVRTLVATLLVRHGFDLVLVLSGAGPELAPGVSRGSLDSAKGGAVLLAFIGLDLVARRRHPIPGAIMVMGSVMVLLAYGTRLLWLTLPLGVPFYVRLTGVRRGATAILMLMVLGLSAIGTAVATVPQTMEVVAARAGTLTVGRAFSDFSVGVEYNVLSRIDPIRYAEAANVSQSLAERRAWMWGLGYGGAYTDKRIPFPSDLESTFPEYSLETRRYYWVHSFPGYILLKHGILGLIIVSVLWTMPAARLFGALRDPARAVRLRWFATCLLAFLPTVILQLFWSGKGLVFSGLTLALMYTLAHHQHESRPDSTVAAADGPSSGRLAPW